MVLIYTKYLSISDIYWKYFEAATLAKTSGCLILLQPSKYLCEVKKIFLL